MSLKPTDKDKVVAETLLGRLKQDREIAAEVRNNPRESVWYSFEKKFNEEMQSLLEENFDFYKRLNHVKNLKEEMMKLMFNSLYTSLRQAG